ncbi:MAG: S53 family peptidase [Actinomycetes bacterium]
MATRRMLTLIAVAVVATLAWPVAVPASSGASPVAVSPRATQEVWDTWPVTFYFGLKRSDAAATQQLLTLSNRANPQFRQWLSADQVASSFGASTSTQLGASSWFQARGFTTAVDNTASFLLVTGQAQLWESSFGQQLNALPHDTTFDIPGTLIMWASTPPALPGAVSQYLNSDELVWAYSTSQLLPEPSASRGDVVTPYNQGTWGKKCRVARNLGGKRGAYAFDQVAHAYGFPPVRRAARSGEGITVGVITPGSGVDEASTRAAEKCWGWPQRSTRFVLASGQTEPAPLDFDGFHEPSLDSQMIRGFLPKAQVVNYQTWVDQEHWFLALSALATDTARPAVASLSYAYCLTAGISTSLFDALTTRLGLMGTTILAASADDGAYPCAGKKPTVDWPASSTSVLGVGGTRLSLTRRNNRAAEVVWNDFQWLSASNAGGATGGGFSANYRRPLWQKATGLSAGSKRAVPDVAAHASRLPGWPVVVQLGSRARWSRESGTSASAPLVAAELAAINAVNVLRGSKPIGFVNPELYRLASKSRKYFFDVTSGNNGVPRVGPGYSAHRGFDPVTGLGVPKPAALLNGLR